MENIKNRIDLKLLQEVLAIQTSSSDDGPMVKYVLSKLSKVKALVQQDSFGNIYVTKGKANDYPCLVAHMDTVQPILKEVSLFRSGDTLFAFNPNTREQTGIGGDDKVGVYILLQALLDLPVLKAVFFRYEESGCLGSSHSILNHKEWYNNCNFIIEPDRRGFSDLITAIGTMDIASNEFITSISEISSNYGYKEETGMMTDVQILTMHKVGVSCINISCGYINAHTNKETVSITGVNTAYNFIYDVVSEFTHQKFPFITEYVPYTRKTNTQSYTNLVNKQRSSQLQLFDPDTIELLRYGSRADYESFIEVEKTKAGKKLFSFIGTNALPLSANVACPKCKTEDNTIYYFPYEGRMMCIKCRRYIDDDLVPSYLRYVETEDSGKSFIYSLLARQWLLKDDSVWDEINQSWVPNDLPF